MNDDTLATHAHVGALLRSIDAMTPGGCNGIVRKRHARVVGIVAWLPVMAALVLAALAAITK